MGTEEQQTAEVTREQVVTSNVDAPAAPPAPAPVAEPEMSTDQAQAFLQQQMQAQQRARFLQNAKDRLYGLTAFIASGFTTRDSDPEHIAERSLAIAVAIVDKVDAHIEVEVAKLEAGQQ